MDASNHLRTGRVGELRRVRTQEHSPTWWARRESNPLCLRRLGYSQVPCHYGVSPWRLVDRFPCPPAMAGGVGIEPTLPALETGRPPWPTTQVEMSMRHPRGVEPYRTASLQPHLVGCAPPTPTFLPTPARKRELDPSDQAGWGPSCSSPDRDGESRSGNDRYSEVKVPRGMIAGCHLVSNPSGGRGGSRTLRACLQAQPVSNRGATPMAALP